MSGTNPLYSIEKSTLTNIADAIRTKKGTTNLIPVPQLAPEILTISGGGGGGFTPTDADLTFSGPNANSLSQYLFAFDNFNWVIENFGDRITLLPDRTALNVNNINLFWGSRNLSSSPKFLKMLENNIINFNSAGLWYQCYNLTEILNLSIEVQGSISVSSSVYYSNLAKLRRLTFKPRTNTAELNVADFSLRGIGYVNSSSWVTSNPDIFPPDKQITNQATYEALKNDPMSWTLDKAYSQFNKQSVIELFNSLPNVKVGSNLKFTAGTGSATEGGDIASLTSEELDIAKSKGWTIISITN